MKYLRISNKGEIELKALKLMGASSKRNDESMIGYFGSGIKYAIAFLKREGYYFEIYSGLENIHITLQKESFRENEYNIIHINGIETSFTAEMGPDWKLWYSIREIYCNALDEIEGDIIEVDEITKKAGYTYFYIEMNNDVKDFLSHFSEYFSAKRNDLVYEHILNDKGYNSRLMNDCDIKLFHHSCDKLIVYRKSIQCKSGIYKSIYDYDLDKITINESRIASHVWEINEKIANMYGKCDKIEVLRKLFEFINNTEYFEGNLDWSYADNFSDVWIDAINKRVLVPYLLSGWFVDVKRPLLLPHLLIEKLINYFGDKITVPDGFMGLKTAYKIKKLEPLQEFMYKSVCDFIKECKINIKYPIKFAEFKDVSILGLALIDSKEIIINTMCFDKGKQSVLMAIIEEHIHIDSGADDYTRSFQHAMLEYLIKYIQEINTIIL